MIVSSLLLFLPAFKAAAGSPAANVIVTSSAGKHWEASVVSIGAKEPSAAEVTIDLTEQRQEVVGFGGAITQATAIQFERLSGADRQKVIDMYYGEDGLRYNVARMPIGSCDFSEYSYNFQNSTDLDMSNFDKNLTVDSNVGMVEFVMRANKACAKDRLLVFGSPWSPPYWMKTDDHPMVGSALPCLKNDSDIQRAWALYLASWIDAYESKTGIDFWGITAQNEPGFWDNESWEACSYTAEQQRDFIRDHLGPIFQKRYGDDKVIMHLDWNKAIVFDWASVVLGDPEAAKYIWGTALHWYDGDHFNNVGKVYEAFGDSHHMLATEGCTCGYDEAQYPTEWARAVRYVHDIIGDMNNGVEGWVDWNLLLDITEEDGRGGPNHAGNYCFAHVQVDDKNKLVIHDSYYAFGQVSKFLPRGSVVLKTESSTADASIETLSARRPDKSFVTILHNSGDETLVFLTTTNSSVGVNVKLEARSITTIEFTA